MTGLRELFSNNILISAAIAWTIAQVVKVPLEYLRTRRWNWALLFRAGGMPSSHSALVACVAHGIGLHAGYNSAVFAIAAALAVIVIYDATGIRRQAGKHAALINAMIQDLAAGHPLKEEQLREVLGHTPLEALTGMILGLVIAQLEWVLFNL
jgi:acid phosphatase family membrane protein YuiD